MKSSSQPDVEVASGKGRAVCPLCNSDVFICDYSAENLQFGRCANCGLSQVRPFQSGQVEQVGHAPSSVTDPSYLEMMAVSAEQRATVARPMARKRAEAYQKMLERSVRSVCEIGAGDGAFGVAYEELGIAYSGFDVNPRMVSVAAMRGRSVVLGSVTEAHAAGRQFDVVFLSQVLEHVLEPRAFLLGVRSLLRDSGLVHIDVPNDDGVSARIRRALPSGPEYGFLQPPHHQIAYSSRTLFRILIATGFKNPQVHVRGNFDPTWGQLSVGPSKLKRAALRVAGWTGMGSLLVATATVR